MSDALTGVDGTAACDDVACYISAALDAFECIGSVGSVTPLVEPYAAPATNWAAVRYRGARYRQR